MNQKVLQKVLSYDRTTGIFTWKKRKGRIAGYVRKSGYRAITIKKKSYYAHRLAWLYEYGVFPVNQIDHRDQNKDNNRIFNLRDVTAEINAQNKALYINNTSRCAGICWNKNEKKWLVRFGINGRRFYFGLYADRNKAVRRARKARKDLGFHENHGKRKVVIKFNL